MIVGLDSLNTNPCEKAIAEEVRFQCDSTTPFGGPLVPDV